MTRSRASRAAVRSLPLLFLLLALPARGDLRSAIASYEAGRRDEAREAFEALGDTRDASYYLALLSDSGEEYARHLQLFLDQGGRHDRRAAEVELRLGRYRYASGDYREALVLFESARDRRTESRGEARYWLGRTLLALREGDDARRALEAVAGDRGAKEYQAKAIMALGELERVTGHPDAAARQFEKLLGDADLGAPAMLASAECRELAGDRREAAARYADLLRARPASAEAAVARVWLAKQAVAAQSPPPATKGSGSDSSAAEAATSPATPALAVADWSVQIGAFASVENARKLVKELEARGYHPVEADRGDDPERLYHVRFGRFPDRDAAETAGREASEALGLRYQLVPPP